MVTLEVSDNRKYSKNIGIVAEILEQGIERSFLFEAKIFLNCLKLSSFSLTLVLFLNSNIFSQGFPLCKRIPFQFELILSMIYRSLQSNSSSIVPTRFNYNRGSRTPQCRSC